jgi:hypothetical protein
MTSLSTKAAIAGLAIALAAPAARAETVNFIPGTYYLADGYLDVPVDTLVVTVGGGTASFTLSGADTATFTVPDGVTPTGEDLAGYGAPYYYIPTSGVTASWDTSAYPYLTFWSNFEDGGLTAGSVPGDLGFNYIDLFESDVGSGQVFTVSGIPEPATWATMLVGLGAVGALSRRRRAVAVA